MAYMLNSRESELRRFVHGSGPHLEQLALEDGRLPGCDVSLGPFVVFRQEVIGLGEIWSLLSCAKGLAETVNVAIFVSLF